MSTYTHIQNTGVGAVNIPYTGKKIKFLKDGSYPRHTMEYLWNKNQELQTRNTFLEDTLQRALYSTKKFNMNDYVYC